MNTTLFHSSREADYFRHETGLVFVKYKTHRKSNSLCHVSNDEAGLKFIEGLKKLFPNKRLRRHYRCPISGIYNIGGGWSRRGSVTKNRGKVIDIRAY